MFHRVEQPFQFPQASGPSPGPTATQNCTSSPEQTGYLKNLLVAIDGTFAADVDVMGQAAAGSSFVKLTTISNGPGVYAIPNDAPFNAIEIVVRNFVSGSIAAYFIGRTAQI